MKYGKKWFAITVILLLTGVAVIPSITANNRNTSSENDSGYPFVGCLIIDWGGQLLNRPHKSVGYPMDRNYSFPVHNGSVRLGFTVCCYVGTNEIFLPIPHLSLFFVEIRDHNGIVQGKNFMLNLIKTKGSQNFNMTLFSKPLPADVNGSDNFTVMIACLGFPPLLKMLNINWISYPIWVSYIEER
jgi:hypothetical protein